MKDKITKYSLTMALILSAFLIVVLVLDTVFQYNIMS